MNSSQGRDVCPELIAFITGRSLSLFALQLLGRDLISEAELLICEGQHFVKFKMLYTVLK